MTVSTNSLAGTASATRPAIKSAESTNSDSSAWNAFVAASPYGDVLQCQINLTQKVDGRTWQASLWTEKIVLQGLRR